ncbi:MAG TPA: mandelate racemase/muconate lactonizing enzyme family protein [Dongiaceae bacterium]|jgi:L-alanine-DL-glutamate epimerase-like enolase superfamily enzyme
MKVTDVEVIALTIPHPKGHKWEKGEISSVGWDQVIVRIHTDEGISGIGEAYHLKNPHAVEAAIKYSLKPLLIGADPFDTAQIWAKLFARTVQLGQAAIAGIAGVDAALWDIKGKALGIPVYKLLGGASRMEVPLYTGGHCLGWRDVDKMDDLIEEAQRYVKAGYKALKVRGGRGLPDRGDIESVKALRKAFGDKIEILVDVNSGYGDLVVSTRMARELAEYNIYWLESPFRFSVHYHNEEMAKLASSAPVPIATGGGIFGRFSVKRLIEQGGIQYVMANVSKAGGLTEVSRIISLIETWNLKYSPHCDGGVNAMGNLHLFASAPPHITENVYHEWDPVWPMADVLTHPPVVKDGKAILTDRPGLGTDLVDDVAKRFPLREDTWFVHKKKSTA